MKVIAPEGVTSFSSEDGKTIEVKAGVAIEVSDAMGKMLIESHGFKEPEAKKLVEATTLRK